MAQTANDGLTPLPPNVSISAIEKGLESILDDSEAPENIKVEAAEFYKSAKEQLQLGQDRKSRLTALKAESATAQTQLKQIADELAAALRALDRPLTIDDAPLTDALLFQMEQDLSALTPQAEILRGAILSADANATHLATRTNTARAEKLAAESQLAEITTQIAGLTEAPTDSAQTARRMALYASRYAREWELMALDEEIASLPLQERLLGPRRDLATAKLQVLERRISALRSKTGRQRLADANGRVTDAQAALTASENAHPLVVQFARDNITYAEQILHITEAGDNSSVIQARVNSRLSLLSEDASLAQQILAEGNIDRKYGAVLRRLRANIPNEYTVKRQIDTRAKAKLDISMQRILAQDKLKEFPVGKMNEALIVARWSASHDDARPLNGEDVIQLRALYTVQRGLLSEVVSHANRKIDEMAAINSQQQKLLRDIQGLKSLLDQRLIWLPSTDKLSLAWPGQVLGGIADILHPKNFITAFTDFFSGLRRNASIAVLVLLLMSLLLYLRPKIMARVDTMSEAVGRVQKDTMWNTPLAVIGGIIRALPVFMVMGLAGYILTYSGGAQFSMRLGKAIMAISITWLVILSVRIWSEDGRLFAVHFKVKKPLRDRVRANMLWFGIVQSVAVILMILCEDYVSDTPTAALGLLGFFVGTLAFAFLTYRLLWTKEKQYSRLLRADGFAARHHKSIFMTAVMIPIFTSALAASGYLATALEVQKPGYHHGRLDTGCLYHIWSGAPHGRSVRAPSCPRGGQGATGAGD